MQSRESDILQTASSPANDSRFNKAMEVVDHHRGAGATNLPVRSMKSLPLCSNEQGLHVAGVRSGYLFEVQC